MDPVITEEGKFLKKLWCYVCGKADVSSVSPSLTLALSLWRRANARNVSFTTDAAPQFPLRVCYPHSEPIYYEILEKKSRPHKYDTELLRLMFPLAQCWALFSFSYSRKAQFMHN